MLSDAADGYGFTVGGGAGTVATASVANSGLSTVQFACFLNTGTGGTWSGYTNDFAEVSQDVNTVNFAVSRRFVTGTTSNSNSSAATTTGTSNVTSVMILRAADSPINAPLANFWGFEWGTHGGTGATGAISPFGASFAPSGTFGTNWLIGSAYARTSGYGLRLVQSGAIANVKLGPQTSGNNLVSYGMNVRVVSATGTVKVAEASDLGVTVAAGLVYDASTNKFGASIAGGTTVWQSGTTALNTWVWVEFRYDGRGPTKRIEWRIETGTNTYTDETATTSTTTAVNGGTLLLGGTAAQTATIEYDDIVATRFWSAYPLYPHTVRLVKVDPAGTPSVSGTTTNFNVFTANGTLAAWNAANARDAVDEVPPTVSASADGVVQNAVAASDYMEFPMATYTCAANEIIAGVRMLAAAWGGTGTGTGTLGIRGHDGTTETTLVAASTSYDAGSPTVISSVDPLWQCAYWPRTNGWTQAALNAATLRVGFSTDATPDMGVNAIYLEVATRVVDLVRTLQTMTETADFTADIVAHPYNSASVSYLITNNDPTLTATFSYSVSGVPQTPVTVGPGSNTTVVVNADNFGDISDIALTE
jgi:hypothetical protein